jgi:cytochrome c oxidase cbb3-type subunit 3
MPDDERNAPWPRRGARRWLFSITNASLAISTGAFLLAAVPKLEAQTASPEAAASANGAVRAGNAIYQDMCAACHGGNGTGGPGGASNLTRSAIAAADDGGKTLGQFLQIGRPEKGMPPFPMTDQQAAQLSAALRALASEAAPSRPAGASTQASIVVGDADTGRNFFNGPVGKCSSCHATQPGVASSATNLAGIATRYPEPKTLQNRMVLNRSFFWSPSLGDDVAATAIYKDGRTVTGLLTSVSDFKVVIRGNDGKSTTIARDNGEPRVKLDDKLQHHLDLLDRYRDDDIHNLTAYLVTLK